MQESISSFPISAISHFVAEPSKHTNPSNNPLFENTHFGGAYETCSVTDSRRGFLAGQSLAQQPLSIRRILLYKNGMAYVVRSGEINNPLNLTFRPDE